METRYSYQSLAASDIRLLVLAPGQGSDAVLCHLTHVALSAKPKYETISYTWGDPSEKCAIECEGKTIQVTVNLYLALQHLRHASNERVIWADAICIDQENLTERSQQVLLMGDIYSQAEQVVVWLGQETEDVSKSFETIEQLNTYFLEHEDGYPNDPERWHTNPAGGSPCYIHLVQTEKSWRGPIAGLARRPWFTRRWVIQEVAKSSHVIVVCGKKQIAWTIMVEVIWSLHKAGMLSSFGLFEDPWSILGGLQSILLIELNRRDVRSQNGSKLLELMISTRRHHCLDRRDVLFSLFGVVVDLDTYNMEPSHGQGSPTEDLGMRQVITPDYESTIEEVYKRFVIASIVKKRSLLPLSATYVRPEPPELDLPSWVPDFSRLEYANPLMELRNEAALPYCASGDSKLCVRFSDSYKTLYAAGKVVEVIQAVAPSLEDVVLPPEYVPDATGAEDTVTGKTRIWLKQCQELACPYGETDPSPPRFDEFSRTMVCNLTGSGGIPPPDFAEMFQQYLDVIHDSEAAVRKHGGLQNPQLLIDRILFVESALGLRSMGWQLCTTRSGRLGRVLKSVREGDIVCIIYGGEVPYILRPCGDGQYTFLGSCYMHGLMNGESLLMEGLEEQEFAIC